MDRHSADRLRSVLAEADADTAAAALAVAAATYAAVSLPDRMRGSLGATITIRTAADPSGSDGITGRLAEVAREGVVLRSDARWAHIVMHGAVETVSGLQPGHRSERDGPSQRRLARILLPAAGCTAELALGSGRVLVGRLVRIGGDHVEMHCASGQLVVGFPAVAWLRCPVADQFESSGSGLSLR